MSCSRLPQCSRRQRPPAWTASIDRAAATLPTGVTQWVTPSIILSPDTRPRTQIRLGARTRRDRHHRPEQEVKWHP